MNGSVRVPFGGACEAALPPFGFAGEGFLLAADVDSSCVDFVVARALEAVEDFVVVVDVGDTGALGHIGTKGPALSRQHPISDSEYCCLTYMVPRMMRGLPVLVMRGMLRMAVVMNGRSGVVCMPVNGLGSGK